MPTELQTADAAMKQADAIAQQRARENITGEALIEAIAQGTYNAKMAAVANSFKLLLGKQFDTQKFLKEVGRLRLRRLPIATLPLTNAAGLHVVTNFIITAPSDRHQLVLNPLFEITGTVARGVVQYRDFTQLTTLGNLTVTRPQSDVVDENLGDFLTGGNQLEVDDTAAIAADRFLIENREFQIIRAMPWGVDHQISNGFAALPALNTLQLSIQNLAAAALTTPSATQLFASLHVYVIDCILGGN